MLRLRPAWGTWLASFLAVTFLGLGAATTASAATAEIQYDATLSFGGMIGWGMTGATAEAAAADLGQPIFQRDDLALVPRDANDNLLLATTRSLTTFGPLGATPATPSSQWTVTNQTANAIPDLFLVFARPLPSVTPLGNPVNYVADTVGLILENDGIGPDWFIFVSFDSSNNPVYYPAVNVGALGVGEQSDPFALNYVLDDPDWNGGASGFDLGIPDWHLLAAFTPIPEPATGLLAALGLTVLAAAGRRGR